MRARVAGQAVGVAPSVRLSKAMSHALRHDPAAYGLTLDAEGWTPVATLVEGLRAAGLPASVEAVRAVVASGSKQRHELSGDRIRARYGHSVEGAVELPVASPPDVLFHGTTPAAAAVIAVEGLRPMGRQYVHLSPARSTAERVGGRRVAEPVVLTVDAAGAARAGVVFRRGNDDTWLAPSVPPEFLSR
ncbi:MAG: putative 2-phosphotransferase [Actinomycetota bacterium]|nr:putative 2-phosphotransferase [Actinomycetota bacterium]